MIMFNKFLMHESRFPFSVCLVLVHMATSSLLALTLYACKPSLFPTAAKVFGEPGEKSSGQVVASLMSFAPLAVLSVASLCAANEAFRFASIAFLQMMKEGSIVLVYIFGLALG